MSNIAGITPTGGTPPIRPESSPRPAPAESPQAPADTVEISLQARIASRMAEIPPVRIELVQRLKAEIAAGTYDTPEKLDIAMQRLFEEFQF